MCNEAARRAALHLIRNDFSELRIVLRFPGGVPNLGRQESIRITDGAVIVRIASGVTDAGAGDGLAADLVQRRWSWPGASRDGRAGKPVYNYRSEGRDFGNSVKGGRCLVPIDGFFEFTDSGVGTPLPARPLGESPSPSGGEGFLLAPSPSHSPSGERAPPSPLQGEGRRKAKWLFTLAGDNDFGRVHDAEPGLFCVAGLWRDDPAVGEAWTMLTCDPGPDIAPYHSRQIVLMPRARWADWLGGTIPARELIAPTPGGTLVATRAR